jgi:hypothetical protein
MRIYRTLLAGLCLLATAALYGQTASLQQTSHNPKQNKLGPMSFSYDAQHNQIVPNGVQLKAHSANSPITPTTGKIVVTVNIHAESNFDHDTEFHCTLLVVGGEIDTTDGVVGGGIETASSVARKDVCTLTIPYSWIIPPDSGASSGMILAVGVAAVDPLESHGKNHANNGKDHVDDNADDGTVPRTTLQVGGVDSIPPNGATTSISFEIVL